MLAASNKPRMLILQAPYYNLTDMMQRRYAFLPTFLLRYPFATNQYIRQCSMPVVIFHGDADEVIDYESSLKLRALFKAQDTLITLPGQMHNNITDNPDYLISLKKIL
jgi:uncharacterized protein